MSKKKRILENLSFLSALSSVAAIAVGLLVGFIILIISNPANALAGFGTILLGGLTGGVKGVGNVLFQAIPIIMTGLSVAFAFKTGIFNIGTAGQFVMGAFAAIYVGVTCTFLPPGIHWAAAVLAAAAAGALWGLLPAVLYACANVNVVISTIMMNYVGMYTANYLITNTVYNQAKNQSMNVQASAVTPKLGMDILFAGSSLNAGIIVAVLLVILLYFLLNMTSFGYELKACGINRDASRYAGINERKCIIISMLVAGALAGLGGGLMYLAGDGKCLAVVDTLAGEGFTGISVALLGLNNPLGVLFAGIFIAYLTMGGFYTQLYKYPTEIIDIMIAVIIYFSAFSLIIKQLIEKIGSKKIKNVNTGRRKTGNRKTGKRGRGKEL